MIGDRIARVARRIVRATTYEEMVAPAVADLQHEVARGRIARIRNYAGVARALAGAAMDDLLRDCRETFTRAPVRRAAWAAAAAVALQNVVFLAIFRFNPLESPAAFVLLLRRRFSARGRRQCCRRQLSWRVDADGLRDAPCSPPH